MGTATSNQFTLDTSALGGARYVNRYTTAGETGGEFRAIQYQVTNAVNSEDLEIHNIDAKYSVGAESMEN